MVFGFLFEKYIPNHGFCIKQKVWKKQHKAESIYNALTKTETENL
jgi:hypothetical protein